MLVSFNDTQRAHKNLTNSGYYHSLKLLNSPMQFRHSKTTSVAIHTWLSTSELNFPKELQNHLSNNPHAEKCEDNQPTPRTKITLKIFYDFLSFNQKQTELSI